MDFRFVSAEIEPVPHRDAPQQQIFRLRIGLEAPPRQFTSPADPLHPEGYVWSVLLDAQKAHSLGHALVAASAGRSTDNAES